MTMRTMKFSLAMGMATTFIMAAVPAMAYTGQEMAACTTSRSWAAPFFAS
jgi:hypothetical protein